jgi:hypothetical protein
MPPFAKTIAPTTPRAADLGGPPASGVTATSTKPMYSSKKPSKGGGKSFGKPAGLRGGKR